MSMFTNAQVLKEKKPVKKAGSKVEVSMDGLKQFAEIDALIKALSAVQATLDADIKGRALNYFIENAGGKRPESFRAIEGIASASIELRKRSSRSALTDQEVEQLTKFGATPEKAIVVQKMFGFNPKYTEDQAVLAKIETALTKVSDLPEDLIVVQEEKSGYIVGEDTIDKAFKLGATAEVVLMVGTLAVKPKLDETDIGVIIESVKGLLIPKIEPAK